MTLGTTHGIILHIVGIVGIVHGMVVITEVVTTEAITAVGVGTTGAGVAAGMVATMEVITDIITTTDHTIIPAVVVDAAITMAMEEAEAVLIHHRDARHMVVQDAQHTILLLDVHQVAEVQLMVHLQDAHQAVEDQHTEHHQDVLQLEEVHLMVHLRDVHLQTEVPLAVEEQVHVKAMMAALQEHLHALATTHLALADQQTELGLAITGQKAQVQDLRV